MRRHVPESPRWLFIHGREEEAERIVRQVEEEVRRETRSDLPEPDPGQTITVRQRDVIPFREIASVTVKRYPRRAVLGLSLFVGQAFLYNAVTFDLGTILNEFFDVTPEKVPYLFVVFAAGNFLGPLLLGRLFDTVGRIPMISGTYLVSAAMVVVLGLLLRSDSLSTGSFMVLIAVTFFFASAGASSAYLTVSEIFPMETRALAISLFYAIGTAVGGIAGPLLFGRRPGCCSWITPPSGRKELQDELDAVFEFEPCLLAPGSGRAVTGDGGAPAVASVHVLDAVREAGSSHGPSG